MDPEYPKFYVCEYGIIPVLGETNFKDWSIACEIALRAAGAWGILKGAELPSDSHSYEKRQRSMISILNGSLGNSYKPIILSRIRGSKSFLYLLWSDIAKEANKDAPIAAPSEE